MVMVMATVVTATLANSRFNEVHAGKMRKRPSSPLNRTMQGSLVQVSPVLFAVMLTVIATGASGVRAQTSDATGARPSLSVVPRVSISETWTDNVRLSTKDRQS